MSECDFSMCQSNASSVSGVSLVVPVVDEVTTVAALISSIKAQTRRPDEVIIVDGGSTDGTPQVVRNLVGDDSTVQIVEAGVATPGRGRNVGRAVARHAWIAFTDAGIELDRRWLECLSEAAERNPVAGVVYGTYEPDIRSFFDSCAVGVYVPARHKSPAGMVRGPMVASMMVKKGVFDQVHGFPDLRSAEDLEFFDRVRSYNVPTVWAPNAIVYWTLPCSTSATYRRFRLYSRQNALAGRKHDWHYGVARIYAAGALVVVAGLIRNRRLLILLPFGAMVRACHNLWRHRHQFGYGFVLNPVRIAGVMALTLVTDAATFAGWASASWRQLRCWPRPWD